MTVPSLMLLDRMKLFFTHIKPRQIIVLKMMVKAPEFTDQITSLTCKPCLMLMLMIYQYASGILSTIE